MTMTRIYGRLEDWRPVFVANPRGRAAVLSVVVFVIFLAIGGQLLRLALLQSDTAGLSIAVSLSKSWARPDIVDRHGRLLATDVVTPSLFADPHEVSDVEDVVDRLAGVLDGLDTEALRLQLSDRERRFVWVRRGLTPARAQAVRDLGIPGLGFRKELRRIYPQGSLAAHVLGPVNVDNRGLSGIERFIDEEVGIELVHGVARSRLEPVRLSLDLGVQFALHSELSAARERFSATAAAGVVLDVRTGEILAASSLPDFDPHRPATALAPEALDRLSAGTFELGSIFKVFTAALALERGATLATVYDTATPLIEGGRTIRDHHPASRPLSLKEIFVRSSNVGAARIALAAGGRRLRSLWARIGAIGALSTEAGQVSAPQMPENWKRIHTTTAAYGHGIAVAPLQFAVAAASLVNGGRELQPTYLAVRSDMARPVYATVVTPRTSDLITKLMRHNVTSRNGTGRAAAVKGYRVGGKTGTAELASASGYRKNAVISSFVATFPTDAPQFLSLVVIFEPKRKKATGGRISASATAAPTTGRLIARIAPMLNVLPR